MGLGLGKETARNNQALGADVSGVFMQNLSRALWASVPILTAASPLQTHSTFFCLT